MFSISHLWIRLLGTGVCLVLLAFFVFPMLIGIRHVGCYAGTLACLLGIVFFAANPKVSVFLGRVWENGTGHIIMCVVIGIAALCGILAVAISAGMLKAMTDKPKAEHPVIVLGCKVRSSGPSLMLQRRLDAAAAYLKEHPDVPVIVCGGQGKDEPETEAQCMYAYLVGHGISADRITKEETSSSTYENLMNAREILNKEELGTQITIVTDGYHQLRASLIASSLSLQADAVSAGTSWYLVPCYWVREWLGVCYQFVFG